MRWIKLSLKVIGSIIALLLILLGGITLYVHHNKERVFAFIKDQANQHINGKLEIGTMTPEILRSFPNISVRLQNVTIRDSLWHTHKRDLLRAENVFVSVNILSFIKGDIRLRDIDVKNAKICLFTDSLGYGNLSVFKRRQPRDTTADRNVPFIGHINFTSVDLLIENKAKFKYFLFDINKLASSWRYHRDGWDANLHLSAVTKFVMFNTKRGSFIKGKQLKTHLNMSYDEHTETLTVPLQVFKIDDDKLEIGGIFVLKETPATFMLNIKANSIKYKNAVSLLSPPITAKLDKFDFTKDIDVQAVIKGHMKYRDTPYVSVTWQVKNNTFITPGGNVEQCTFTGIFNNERVKNAGYKDDNALVEVKGLQGRWHSIPFRADTLSISNLVAPVLQGRFTSQFDVTKLNDLAPSAGFHFDGGKAVVNILYRGGVFADDTTQPYMFGTIRLTGLGLTYVPRGLSFSDSRAILRFAGTDVFIDSARLQRGSNVLNMQGRFDNFLNFYYTAPEKIVWDWQVSSPSLDLNEFTPFLKARAVQRYASDSTAVGRLSARINRFLDASSVRMKVKVGQLRYRQFAGHNLHGEVAMSGNDIVLEDFCIDHADGKLRADVKVKQAPELNSYELVAAIEHVDIKQFLKAFEDFGQNAVTGNEISGRLSTSVDVAGGILPDGTPAARSINGTVAFKLENGVLVNFVPLSAISSLVFRNRNLDSIAIRNLENRFSIKGDQVVINPMFIESSALNMHVQGTYSLGKSGTDIDIDIPLRNPKKDELVENDELRHERNMKGIVLHLKAQNDADGKVKIKWNRGNEERVQRRTERRRAAREKEK